MMSSMMGHSGGSGVGVAVVSLPLVGRDQCGGSTTGPDSRRPHPTPSGPPSPQGGGRPTATSRAILAQTLQCFGDVMTPFDGGFTTGLLLFDHFLGRLGDKLLVAELLVDLADLGVELADFLFEADLL